MSKENLRQEMESTIYIFQLPNSYTHYHSVLNQASTHSMYSKMKLGLALNDDSDEAEDVETLESFLLTLLAVFTSLHSQSKTKQNKTWKSDQRRKFPITTTPTTTTSIPQNLQ